VKETIDLEMDDEDVVDYFIKNSVKESLSTAGKPLRVEDTIQNGVKQTKRSYDGSRNQRTKYVIQNGVKDTKLNNRILDLKVEDTIQNGVKESREVFIDMVSHVEDTVQNGEKIELK